MKTIIINAYSHSEFRFFEEKRFSYICSTCGKEIELLVKFPMQICNTNYYNLTSRQKFDLFPRFDEHDKNRLLNIELVKYQQDDGLICDDCLSIKDIIE